MHGFHIHNLSFVTYPWILKIAADRHTRKAWMDVDPPSAHLGWSACSWLSHMRLPWVVWCYFQTDMCSHSVVVGLAIVYCRSVHIMVFKFDSVVVGLMQYNMACAEYAYAYTKMDFWFPTFDDKRLTVSRAQ